MKTLLWIALAGFLLSGCAGNPYTKYYHDYTSQMPTTSQQRLLPATSAPQVTVVSGNQMADEARHLQEQGYMAIGQSCFQGKVFSQGAMLEQAKKVQAELVLASSELLGTHQGVEPMTTYQPGQTYHTTTYGTGNANAFGSNGYASATGNFSGSSTTTSSGTYNTQYVPYQYQLFKIDAVFFKRSKAPIFGVSVSGIPDSIKASIQRNTGAYVSVVTQGSPAFLANILEGDIIIQFADKTIATPEELLAVLPEYTGQKVTVSIIRNGKTISVDVQLGAS